MASVNDMKSCMTHHVDDYDVDDVRIDTIALKLRLMSYRHSFVMNARKIIMNSDASYDCDLFVHLTIITTTTTTIIIIIIIIIII